MTFQFRKKNDSGLIQKGFFGIGILDPKHEPNVAVLWRSAAIFGASFLATVGERRYKTNKCDTVQSHRHIPLFHFNNLEDLREHLPKCCQLIGVELTNDSRDLQQYCHPQQAMYLLGSEDTGLSFHVLQSLDQVIKINTPNNISLNLSVAGSIILYDRIMKNNGGENV